MGWVSGIVVFLLLWWTSLFCILPLGVQSTEGNESIPKNPRLLQKALITTVVSGILWLVIYTLIDHKIINFYDMAEQMAADDMKITSQTVPQQEQKK